MEDRQPVEGIKAYSGNGKYVFISYAHKDVEAVFPIIDYLQKRGYNIWFDEGIVVGSSWPDYIAEQIQDCSCFIGFISPNSVASVNCQQEIYFAASEQKDIVSVMLDEVDLPAGLRMQLSMMQAIEKNNYSSEAQFYIKLLENEKLEECKDTEEFQIHGDALLKYNGGLTSIVVPDGIGRIGFNAFEGCDSVVSVRIPASVEMIGKYAFRRMRNLQEIIVEPGNFLFSSVDGVLYNRKMSGLLHCPAGKNYGSFTVPDGVKFIGMLAFTDAVHLTEITMPDSIGRIGERAFEGCSSLVHVEISGSVDRLRPYTFDRCSSLVACDIPESVRVLSDGVFNGCVSLRSIKLPATLESVGELCFAYCDALEEVRIPDGVDSIAPYCFYECLSLRKAHLGLATSVKEYAFKNCVDLEELELSPRLESIGRAAFSGCSSLATLTVPGSVKRIGRYAFDRSPSLEEVVLEEGVEVIEDGAFERDTALRRVVLPRSVSAVGEGAFPDWTEVVRA